MGTGTDGEEDEYRDRWGRGWGQEQIGTGWVWDQMVMRMDGDKGGYRDRDKNGTETENSDG